MIKRFINMCTMYTEYDSYEDMVEGNLDFAYYGCMAVAGIAILAHYVWGIC